jgi:hypothetical protein
MERTTALDVGIWPLRLGVLALVALVYAPTLNDPFAGDDYLVLGPVRALGSWELIWKSFVMQDNIPYWRPLVSPLYAFEIHGIGLRPTVFHVIALGLHLLNALVLMLIAQRLTARHGVAVLAGLLFGVHAAHTTTVAQISSTVELQSVVFYLLTVWCAARLVGPHPLSLSQYWERGVTRLRSGIGSPSPNTGRGGGGVRASIWYLLSLISFVLALLTKESTASAAAVVGALFLLLDPAPAGRVRRAAFRTAPFAALVLPYALFTYLGDTDEPTGIARAMYGPGPHALQNLWWLTARLAAPLGAGHGPHVSAIGHLGAVLAVGGAAVILIRGSMLARFLVLWTFIALTPLSLWRPDLMLGRFTYQAAAPLSVLLALGLVSLPRPSGLKPAAAVTMRVVIALALVAVLAVLTVRQNRERTSEALAYGELERRLPATLPRAAAPSAITILGGPFDGPFHALYLQAMADTRYGPGTATLEWLPAESDVRDGSLVIRWPVR